jgi:hypothetical protein
LRSINRLVRCKTNYISCQLGPLVCSRSRSREQAFIGSMEPEDQMGTRFMGSMEPKDQTGTRFKGSMEPKDLTI